ncbi:MAG: 2-oxoglutarate dehydrogenase E1 component, partial [Tagaea sp.]|nr:2-oxoglutarate dehydrogenase E1 component [Tagaea sp.]
MATHPDLDTLFNAGNAVFVAELLDRYRADPASVDPSWHGALREMLADGPGYYVPRWGREKSKVIGAADPSAAPPAKGRGANGAAAAAAPIVEGLTEEQAKARTLDSIRAIMLIRAYRMRGHLEANLDPLGLTKREPHPELDPKHYGFA